METAAGVRMTHKGYFLRVPERGVHALTSHVTEDENLFLLAHMGLAEVEPHKWSLRVGGLVRNPVSFSLADLLAMREHEVMSVHECAGSPLAPTVAKRRVGNVIWSGVRLSEILGQCGLARDASFIWTHGSERGDFADLTDEAYVKDLPLAKAISPEVLIATGMNGMPLRSERGGPVRLVVPGWYGTNSVKWLAALTVADHRSPGPYTSRFYNDTTPSGPRPVWGIAPESILVLPAPDNPPTAGQRVLMQGWAWAESDVAKVEVSINGGNTWMAAILEPRWNFSWQRFSLPWKFEAGEHRLCCRCFDSRGIGQPESGARNAIQTVILDVLAS